MQSTSLLIWMRAERTFSSVFPVVPPLTTTLSLFLSSWVWVVHWAVNPLVQIALVFVCLCDVESYFATNHWGACLLVDPASVQRAVDLECIPSCVRDQISNTAGAKSSRALTLIFWIASQGTPHPGPTQRVEDDEGPPLLICFLRLDPFRSASTLRAVLTEIWYQHEL